MWKMTLPLAAIGPTETVTPLSHRGMQRHDRARIPRRACLTRCRRLTGFAADAGAMEGAEALALLASTAQICLIRRS